MLQNLLKKKRQVAAERLKIEDFPAQGGGEVSEIQRRELQQLIDEIERDVALLQEMGCIVRHIDEGIVDFPALRYGKQVYLCYRLGEPEVAYWHDMKSGFAGRARITEAEIVKAYV